MPKVRIRYANVEGFRPSNSAAQYSQVNSPGLVEPVEGLPRFIGHEYISAPPIPAGYYQLSLGARYFEIISTVGAYTTACLVLPAPHSDVCSIREKKEPMRVHRLY
jgi:hypothetical protein